MRYDYSNNILDGNTRDDGEPCTDSIDEFPPDGCLYYRPPDRTDDFFNLSPNIGALYKFTDATVGFANFTSGFRAPQVTELYRLQAQQDPADIDSEQLDSIEVGTRHQGEMLRLETVAFYMRKSNAIFRDSAEVNVSDGRTKHYGIESNIDWRIVDPVYLSLTGSYAKQTYDFDREAAQGEIITKGNEIDTAPQILGSARLGYEQQYGIAELEWVYQDEYFLDAANTAVYEGHDLLNLRLIFKPSEIWAIALRINNLTNVRYADRADLLSSVEPPSYRYFPGHEREFYVELTWNTPDT
jgi:outer membrane receptor protein involved in Fe transport